MARETKADKEARLAAEKQLREDQITEEMNYYLMSLLERATDANFELTVVDGKFLIQRMNDYEEWVLPKEPQYSDYRVYSSLACALTDYESELAESKRQFELKQSALSKLTDEERKVLGV